MHMPQLILCCILSLTCILTHAQDITTRAGCIDYCHQLKADYLDDAFAAAGITASWCFFWYVECLCIEGFCGGYDIKCKLDGGPYGLGSGPYGLGSGPYGIGFDPYGGDNSCTVEVDPDVVPSGAVVPGSTSSSSSPNSTFSGGHIASSIIPISSTEIPAVSIGAAAGSAALVVGAVFGSLFTAKQALSPLLSGKPGAFSGHGQGHPTINAVSVGAVGIQGSFLSQCASAVDPVSLLLHFQFLSFSGLLSLAYPANFLGFTYNFGFANFLFPSPPFEVVANGMTKKSCWKAGHDHVSPGGFATLAFHYGIPVQDLAGIVYISALTGIGIALALFVLVGAILFLLERTTRSSKMHKTIKRFQQRWPAISSRTTLRLFKFVLGTISAFAFFQFAHSCGGAPLAVAIVEFLLILGTLIIVSMFITRVARGVNGLNALFAEDKDSKYASRWGILYLKFRPDVYWFFIPDYCSTIAESAIIAFTQGEGLLQICLLIGLKLAIFIVMVFKRPFKTPGANANKILKSGYHFVHSSLLSTFLTQVRFGNNMKRAIGIVLMSLGIAYAGLLLVLLVIKAGAAFIDWRIQRRQKSNSSPQPQLYGPYQSDFICPGSKYIDWNKMVTVKGSPSENSEKCTRVVVRNWLKQL